MQHEVVYRVLLEVRVNCIITNGTCILEITFVSLKYLN